MTYVQSHSNFFGFSAAAITDNYPGAVTAHNILVAAVFWADDTSTCSVTDPTNGTWTAFGTPQRGVGTLAGNSLQAFYKLNAGAGSYTITATTSAASGYIGLAIMEEAATASWAFDQGAYLNTNAATAVPANTTSTALITPSQANAALVAACLVSNNAFFVNNSPPWTERESANFGGNGFADNQQTTAIAASCTWALSGDNDQVNFILSFVPSSGGAGDAHVTPASINCTTQVGTPTWSGTVINASVTPAPIQCLASVPFFTPTFSYALVGTIGAASLGGAVNTAVTPAWGTSEARSAGNLLILWVGGGGTATFPTTPSGWSIGKQQAGTSCSASIFYKIATGGDAAPTVAALGSTTWSAQLAEFSGGPTSSPLDKTAGNAGTSLPVVATAASADVTGRQLVLAAAHAFFSTARNPTATTHTLNNGATASTTANSGSNVNHYGFAYGITTGNAAADSDSFTMTGTVTSLTGVAVALVSFLKPQTTLTVTPKAIAAVTAVPAPLVTTLGSGDALVFPATISCRASVPTPSLSTGSTVTPSAITAVTAVPSPTVTATSGGGLPPARLQSWSTSTQGGVTSCSGQAPNNVVTGSTIICLVSIGVAPTETVTSVVDDLGNNFWKVIETPFNNFGLASLWVLNTPVAQVGHRPIITANKSGGGWTIGFLCQEVSNLPTGTTLAALCDGTPLYTQAPLSTPSSPTNDVPYSSTATGEYTIACYTDPNEGPHTVQLSSGMTTAGWTRDSNSLESQSAPVSCAIAYKASIGGLETPNTWAISANDDWNQVVIAFKKVSGTTDASVTPATISCLTAVGLPLINATSQSASVTPATISCVTTVPPLLPRISTTIVPTAVHAITAVPTPSIQTGSVVNASVTPTSIHVVATVPTLTGSQGSVVTPTAVAAITAVPTPTIQTTVTVTGTVAMAASAGMTVTATMARLASVVLAGGASLNVSAIQAQFGTVSMAATAGMTVAASVIEQASVPMAATTTMTVAATRTQFAAVPLAASAALTVSGQAAGAVAAFLSASASMVVSPAITVLGSVPLSGTAGLSVAGVTTRLSTVAMAATAGLTVAGAPIGNVSVTMAATTSLTVAAGGFQAATVGMAALAGLTVSAAAGTGNIVALTGSTSMTVLTQVTVFGQVNLAASGSLVIAGRLLIGGTVSMAAAAAMTVVGNAFPYQIFEGVVAMSATTGMVVIGLVTAGIPSGPPKPIIPYDGSGMLNPGDPYGGWTAPDETLYNIPVPQVPPYSRSP